MLRAANTGISAVIDAHGRLIARLGLDRAGVLVAPIPGHLPQTWVGRTRLWTPLILAVWGLAFGNLCKPIGRAVFKKREFASEM